MTHGNHSKVLTTIVIIIIRLFTEAMIFPRPSLTLTVSSNEQIITDQGKEMWRSKPRDQSFAA